jgi:C-8 sterol isomerase
MSHIFDPSELHAIAREAVAGAKDLDGRFRRVIDALDARYPGRICRNPKWILNSANGALGQLALLYGSLTEYVILFGSPVGTEGHSGRYLADVHDFMLDGEMWAYMEGETRKQIFKPGDAALLPRGKSKGYVLRDKGWMLEYARGIIPSMMPSGLADNFFSNLDMYSAFATTWHYGRMVIGDLRNRCRDRLQCTRRKGV